MKQIVFIFGISLLITQCRLHKQNKNDIQTFFIQLANFYCLDSVENDYDIEFIYQDYDAEQMKMRSSVPDNIEYSSFYNAYSDRIIDVCYQRMKLDSMALWDSLFKASNSQIVKENIINYYRSDSVFVGVFDESLKAYTNSKKPNGKPVFLTVDSLVNISLSYLEIAGYSDSEGFFIRLCGVPPFKSNYSNRLNIIIAGFCKEAISNKEMLQAIKKISDKMNELVQVEKRVILNKEQIEKEYKPLFYGLIKEDGTLQKSLLDYYAQRGGVEPFEIIE